jgi:tRNA-dihydrouridine synthase B
VVRASPVPVTVKIRTGIDRNHINGVRISRIAAEAGVRAIAVHGRTRADFYEGEAEYDTLREICAGAAIPVIANGDIDNAHKARAVLDFTRANAVMMGRAAHGAPWIFRDVNAFLENGSLPTPLLRGEIRDIILHHLEALYVFHGETHGVRIARKHLGWYCQQHTQTAPYRPSLMAAENSSAQFAVAAECFGRWADNENNIRVVEQVDGADEDKGREHEDRAQADPG